MAHELLDHRELFVVLAAVVAMSRAPRRLIMRLSRPRIPVATVRTGLGRSSLEDRA